MLCQFTVKNFRCFRDEITLDMQATPIKDNDKGLITGVDGGKFLPLAVIYGPNAGGKSTVLLSLYSLLLKIMKPVCALKCENKDCTNRSFCHERAINIPVEPFAFNGKSINQPTEYELFFRTATKEYHYQTRIKNSKVIYEELSHKKLQGGRYSTVFVRKKLNIELKGSVKSFDVSEISDTLPLLSYFMITHSRNAIMKDIFTWLDTGIDFKNFILPLYDIRNDYKDEDKPLILSLLREMDIDIDNYRHEESDNRLEVFTTHKINGKEYELPLAHESEGSIKMFALLPYIIDNLRYGGTLVIDELDAKIHPHLLEYVIDIYKDPNRNKNGSQLIFTSHDISTMKQDCFRRDEIWYVAKSDEGAAKLYSLAEIARNDAVYSKQYLEGKYGACPYLKRIIDWEDLK